MACNAKLYRTASNLILKGKSQMTCLLSGKTKVHAALKAVQIDTAGTL